MCNTVQCPGLGPESREIPGLREEFCKRLAVHFYKSQRPYLWVVFLGGTGTGKSTLFNVFCGESLSETGVERPKTRGPIIYAPRQRLITRDFPFPDLEVKWSSLEDQQLKPVSGIPGHLFIIEHDRESLLHLVVVDTPDLDSIEPENRRLAADLYLLADVIVFVTSQEKYADEIPYQFLLTIIREKRPHFVLVNKAEANLTAEEVLGLLESHGVSLAGDRLWLIPYAPQKPFEVISRQPLFADFIQKLWDEFADAGAPLLERLESERLLDLRKRLGRLEHLLKEESQASQQWLGRLEELFSNICSDLIEGQKERFATLSRDYLQREIRKLYAKYDVLARPRRLVRQVFLTPLRLLGLHREDKVSIREEALSRVRQKIDPTAVQAALERFNREVLAELSPADETAPLFRELRHPGVLLTDEEIQEFILLEQNRLARWLQETFEKLSQGIPRGKEWGIYSTSVLWGLLLLSFETAVGGGFTLVDAALDTALAPFLTKGAVELFAYHEIQKVARELAGRYEQGLVSVLREQRDRYRQCLDKLMTPAETLDSLAALQTVLTTAKA